MGEIRQAGGGAGAAALRRQNPLWSGNPCATCSGLPSAGLATRTSCHLSITPVATWEKLTRRSNTRVPIRLNYYQLLLCHHPIFGGNSPMEKCFRVVEKGGWQRLDKIIPLFFFVWGNPQTLPENFSVPRSSLKSLEVA